MNQPFTHPGMLHTKQDLTFMKEHVHEEPWKTAYANLCAQPFSSLDFKPEPHTHVIRGPYGKPSIGDKELSGSANAAYSHALQWVVTGDEKHANKAIEILNAWSGVIWDFQLNDAKLLAAWTGDYFCNAAEILKHTDSGWAEKDIEQFKRMMLTVYYPLLENFFPEANGNWDGAIINTLLCVGIFCDDHAMFNRVVNHYLRGRGNGGITKYVYPSGQCQESTRDQSHTQLGLNEFALACQVAWHQGVDLYKTADNRLALGFEHAARYMLGEDVETYGTISEQGRERIWDIYETVFQHYHHVKGLEMPYCQRAVEQTRKDEKSWLALTMYRGAIENAPQTWDAPKPSLQAPHAGAQSEPTTQPPDDAIWVTIEDSLQAVLDGCAKGAWVVLDKGIYTLPETLKIPNKITLSGQGLETVLHLNSEKTGSALANEQDDLNHVTLRDLVIEGAVKSESPRDPNSARRTRSYASAPSRAGIVFAAQHARQMHDLHFEHVTVQNCTLDGVAIRGAQNVTIVACDFSDSGSSVVPGPGLQHNLLITRSDTVEIRDSRFDTSPWGSGVDISHCQNVKLSNCEVARNALHGVHVTESERVHIVKNLVEGNDAHGIVFDKQMDGCKEAMLTDNLSRNNGKWGICVSDVVDETIENNVVIDNQNDQ